MAATRASAHVRLICGSVTPKRTARAIGVPGNHIVASHSRYAMPGPRFAPLGRGRRYPPARERDRDFVADALDEGGPVLVGTARDRLADPHPDPDAPGNGQHLVREEPPGLVDGEGHDRDVRGRLEEGGDARPPELAEHSPAGPCALGEDDRGDPSTAHPLA